MKQIVNLLADFIVKYTPFKGTRHKLGSLITIIGSLLLLATGQLQQEVAIGAILLALNDLFAGAH